MLIGTSGQPGCFDQAIVNAMMQNSDRPVILPLSNPTTNTEALPKDLYQWTDGNAWWPRDLRLPRYPITASHTASDR